jgi:predicted RNA-binding Zn-ribbon protein involved in translation (DUF1610 family)
MTSCRHKNLYLLPGPEKKLRCTHCHLTINKGELEADYCPECWETRGIRNRNFEEVARDKNNIDIYRCEKCGILIEVS